MSITETSTNIFPINPEIGDTFRFNGTKFIFNGFHWYNSDIYTLVEDLPVLGGSNSKTVSLVQSEVEALRNLLNLFQLNGNQELLSIYRKINNL